LAVHQAEIFSSEHQAEMVLRHLGLRV